MVTKTWISAAALVLSLATTAIAQESPGVDADDAAAAERVMGLSFTQAERDSLLGDLSSYLRDYESLRGVPIANGVPPALVFDPVPGGRPAAAEDRFWTAPRGDVARPQNLEELAFYSIGELAELIRSRRVSSLELTQVCLARLERYGPELECVVTLTGPLALAQARRADAEIAAGNYRGPLHGIPYGAKDLLAVSGYRTTWGARPFENQMLDETATVIRKLEDAGAVLVAKLTLGALAWGDVWFGGTTRNPWDLEQGSSGSSAGSASATAAGLVPFAIGTETWGSIVSPATRCGATGLRPTFGRVSRAGAMALSWSMDKIGPICRNVEDCAIVFDAIRGPDGLDASVVDAPFRYDAAADLAEIRVGYVRELFDEDYPNRARDAATLDTLRGLGVDLQPVSLPDDYPVGALALILSAEAAAAFDDLTRSGRDDELVRQVKDAWPTVFRGARYIPAVEYIQANRLRTLIMREMERLPVDVYLAPSFGGDNLLLTNLTGHSCVVLPNGFDESGHPTSITFIGRLFEEGKLLRVAKAYQDATDFHRAHPARFTP